MLGMLLKFFLYVLLVTISYVVYMIHKNSKISNLNLSKKHVLVTGGSSGIGKSVGILAAKAGAHVTIIARNPEKLNAARELIVAACIKPDEQKVTSLPLDVTQNYEETKKQLADLESGVCPVDMLVNCAGSAECSTLENASEASFRRMLDLNVMGTVLPTKIIADSMKQRGEGIIVITSSLASLLGIYGMGAYCASKWALRGFAETLHQEMKPHNISVTLCLPPDTDTPGFENENKDKPDVTKLICESGGLISPDAVAQKLLNDALNKKFWSTVGFEGNLLITGCAGFSPFGSLLEVIPQVFLSGFIRLISIIHLKKVHSIIHESHLKSKSNVNS